MTFASRILGPSVRTSMLPSLSRCATGRALIERKASLREVCILRTLVPWCTAKESSPGVSCITTNTPERSALVAKRTQAIRLLDASEEGRSEERWAPTRMTGFGTSPSMKDRAAAVYPMVSVPWGIMTASAPSFISSATALASSCQWAGSMFSENIENRTRASMFASSRISGTALTMSEVESAGWTAPVL